MFKDFLDNTEGLGLAGSLIGVFVLALGSFIVKRFVFFGFDKISKENKWKKPFEKGIFHLILAGSTTLIVQGIFSGTIHLFFKVWIGICLTWILYCLTEPLCFLIRKNLFDTQGKEFQHLFGFAEQFLKVTVLILGGLLIAQNIGLNVTSLLAGLGIGGIAVALAAKDTLSNLFGSLVIALDRPFLPGDFIQFDQVEGVVENIGVRSTQIKTFYDSTISVPNVVLAQTKIDNMGKRKYRRSRFTLGLTYSTPADKIETFIQGIKDLIQSHPKSRKDYFQVSFSGYSSSSLDILVNVFFEVSEWVDELNCQQEFYLDILRLAHKEGVEFAFPSQSLYIEKMSSYKPNEK